MSTAAGAEKVFPAGGGAPAGGGQPPAPKGKSGGMKFDRKTIMWGGAGAVALFAFLSTRGGASEPMMNIQPAEFDSTAEDLYGNLQPELEAIQNAIRDSPAPVTPEEPGAQDPKPNKSRTYTVKRGDKLWQIARRFGVDDTAIYSRNRGRIRQAALKRGHKNAGWGSKLFAGTKLVIPPKE